MYCSFYFNVVGSPRNFSILVVFRKNPRMGKTGYFALCRIVFTTGSETNGVANVDASSGMVGMTSEMALLSGCWRDRGCLLLGLKLIDLSL